jgi:hypothetical protein
VLGSYPLSGNTGQMLANWLSSPGPRLARSGTSANDGLADAMRARSRHRRSPAQFYKIPAAQRQHSAHASFRVRGRLPASGLCQGTLTGASYCRNPIIPSALRTWKNVTVFSKSGFESCFKQPRGASILARLLVDVVRIENQPGVRGRRLLDQTGHARGVDCI